ncbi:MAG: hypothetical protein CMJ83_13810 [Planctomycetes bacterium]|nr:hypothetical protein [Planctomycetota bacterium]
MTRSVIRVIGRVLGSAVALLCHTWAILALHFGPFDHAWVRYGLAAGYVVIVVLLMAKARRRILASLLAFAAVCGWWTTIEPSKEVSYPPAFSRLTWAESDGDQVTVHDVRNFHYRTETDFDARYEDRAYRMDEVQSVDLFVAYWDGYENVAHTFLSFGFSDGRYLCVSIEARREKNEAYAPLTGIFKQYELIYVWCDEGDIVQLRSNHRKEDVYLYRTTCSPAESRLLMKAMLDETTRLRERPVFYNTVTRSCTSSIVRHVNEVLPRKIPWWRRRLMNGYDDRRAYDHGWLANDLPFDELKRRARIGERARASADDADFSERIRQGG